MNKEIQQKNVLGEELEICSNNPLTGWFRDGCCNTNEIDHGVHTVCAKVTTKFLEWAKDSGNDLSLFNLIKGGRNRDPWNLLRGPIQY